LAYVALDVAPEGLNSVLTELVAERAAGNVTIPHKEAVAGRATLTPLAERAGAVNTFWIEDGDLHGDNTDIGGFDATVRSLLGRAPTGVVALLGAGGSAAAVLTAVEGWPGCTVRVHARTPQRAEALCARFSSIARPVGILDATLAGAALVVNATPIGMRDGAHPAPLDRIPADAGVVDLVYRPGGTPWSRAAIERGHPATDGLPMLIEQGALAFERWFGIAADRAAMWASLDEKH
jgi:shikimate dehydrogenase